MGSSVLRLGVIGLGMGGGHARTAAAMPEAAKVTALCDIDQERLQALGDAVGGVELATDDYNRLLERDDLDAVVVALPNHLHHPVSVAAFQAGKHVLCEKPPALNAQLTAEMFDAAEKAERILMIGLNQRYLPTNRWLRACVDEGRLGVPYYGKSGWLRRRHRPSGWFTTKALSGGGPLIDLGVHMLDLSLWLMGYPRARSVKAQVVNKLTPDVDVEDLAVAFIDLEGDAAVRLENSLNLNIEKEVIYCEVAGTRGGLRAYPPAFFYDEGATSVNMAPADGTQSWGAAGQDLMREFLACAREGKPAPTTREEMITLMKILDAIYRSAQTGREEVL